LSQQVIKKMRVREIPGPHTKKKSMQVRETLVPKMIQFEGAKFDGINEAFKMEYYRSRE
jgi:hypothetical protein